MENGMSTEARIECGDPVAIRGRVARTWVDADLRRGTRMAQLELSNGSLMTVPVAVLERAESPKESDHA